jgi:hypothetical protein
MFEKVKSGAAKEFYSDFQQSSKQNIVTNQNTAANMAAI